MPLVVAGGHDDLHLPGHAPENVGDRRKAVRIRSQPTVSFWPEAAGGRLATVLERHRRKGTDR